MTPVSKYSLFAHLFVWFCFFVCCFVLLFLRLQTKYSLHDTNQVYESNLTSQSYSPPRPGLYSVVLGASDLANNTKYVRRLMLFDPLSGVTSDPDHALFVSTASEAANYTYQSNITSDVVVTWEGHFRNAFLEDNGLLGKILCM